MAISLSTLQRLPADLRILKSLEDEEYVSSTLIAQKLNLSNIQVRKDLACVSTSEGKARLGFNREKLIKDIEAFLEIDNTTDVIVVGAGRIGQALMQYKNFENNVNIIMGFDSDLRKCDNKKIFPLDRLQSLVKRMNIHIAILSVPADNAQEVCDLLVRVGIKGIWNFTTVHLDVPEDVIVKNEDLSASLMLLVKQLRKENE